MLSKISEWFDAHVSVLAVKSGPIYIFLGGCLFTIIVLFFYNYNIINLNENPFVGELISKNRNYLKHGYWIIPLVGIFASLCKAKDNHQKNTRKIYN